MSVLEPAWLVWLAMVVLASRLHTPLHRLVAITTLGLAFVSLYDPVSAGLLVGMSLIAYYAGPRLSRGALLLSCTMVLLLGVLIAFKLATSTAGVAMPLGLSYYTFRCLHYLLERFMRRLPPHSFPEFLAYMFFFPTLLAGPIHRFPEFHRDLRRTRASASLASEGLERIVYGYAKIVVLANYLVLQQLVALAQHAGEWSPRLGAYIGMLAGGLNGYLQFAGYSDIAIGAALLLGFRVMENFDSPFLSRNIVDFWQRWHISLTSWARDYLYRGVFAVSRRPYLAAVATMLAIGLWHEISLRYVAWGFAHGIAIAACQWFQRNREGLGVLPRGAVGVAGPLAGWFLTFHFVMLSFVLVQNDWEDAMKTYRTLFVGHP